MARQTLAIALAGLLGVAGCFPAGLPAARQEAAPAPGVAVAVGDLAGSVRFPTYRVQATIVDDVAPGATVSLIEPATGFTIASTVTDAGGRFLLTFSGGFVPSAGKVYILEAVKGLKDDAGFNAPGSAVVRVRTFARFAGTWGGLTSDSNANITAATTAVTALAGLKGLKDADAGQPISSLFGKLEQGTADGDVVVEGRSVAVNARFTATPAVSVAEFRRVFGLVSVALADDADPIAAVFRDPAGATADAAYQRSPAPTAILGFAEPKAARGQQITLVGRNLSGDAEVWFTAFAGSVDSDIARVGVLAATGSLSADRRRLQVTVPARAASGAVVYRRGLETYPVSNLYGIVGTVATVVGTGRTSQNGDSLPGDRTNLGLPYFLAVDAQDNPYWGDLGHNQVRRWERRTGVVRTLAGNGGGGHAGDGGSATAAQLSGPVGIDYDPQGNLWIAEYGSNYIRKVDKSGVISTAAGNGTRGLGGDGGLAKNAIVGGPHGLSVDRNGVVYFCDYYNGRIRKIDPTTGIIDTVAVVGCVGVRFGPDGYLYIDNGSIARLDPVTKQVTTYVTHSPAPWQDLWVDAAGNVFFPTWGPGSNQIYRVDATTKAITLVAGSGADGFSGDGGDPKAAAFFRTSGVAADRAGNLFIADYSNSRIRYVALP
ncbi:MAG: hypothetical protein FJZ01_01535 [Candidatus Sericytochromatia bacterium]|nr:hypothetical protein [Candidatus Tanganyikabacteria bacterium]